jgi:tetratricopeptide (TPR) repeat protein
MIKKIVLFVCLLSLFSCCLDYGSKEKKFKKRVLCAQRVNNDNSLFILKNGAFCCPKLPPEVNDLTSAKIFYYKKALEIDNTRIDGWEALGETCWDGGRYKEGIEYFEKASELSPQNIRYKIAIVSLLRITKDYDKAMKKTDEMEKMNFIGKDKTLSYLKGKLLYEMKDIDGAMKLLEKSRERYEGEDNSHFLSGTPYTINDLYFYLAQCYLKSGDPQKAHQYFLNYIQKERHPDFVGIYQKALEETGGEQLLLYDEIEDLWTRTHQ